MFREQYTDVMDGEILDHKPHPLPEEMMKKWLATTGQFECEVLQEQIEEIEDGAEEDDELHIPELEEYKRMICSAPSYVWVVGQLRRGFLLSGPITTNAMDDIREGVLEAVPRIHHVSRSAESQTVEVLYTVEWDALAFFRGQEYEDPPDEVINHAVTLTGSTTDAQACSCQQFMDQTWPCTGLQTLKLIRHMLQNPDLEAHIVVTEPSVCKLAAALYNGRLMVRAWGIPEFVAEIAEQIAWLGAALQLSPYGDNVVSKCTPFIDKIESSGPDIRCHIKFYFEPCQDQPGAINGQCWHDMFHRPVIVQGFPILRRSELNTGLEMPIDLMTSLTRTRYVDEFSSRMYIKGFSTMLIPTKQFEDTVYWHLLFNRNPEQRIPYLECGIEHAVVQKTDLEVSRHILGWCSDAVNAAGGLLENYNISRSQLPFAHSSCALDKVEIHAGQLVSGTACFSLGNREKPVHISRDGYFTKLSWISSRWVVFWDEGEKRGWLVNGASALLHVLRASLAHSQRKFRSAFLMCPQDLEDGEGSMGAGAALQLLACERNRSLPLYRENVEFETSSGKDDNGKGPETRFKYYRLEHQVEHIYSMFEKLVEHQTNAEQRNRVRISSRPRRQLEGWDFKDLVTDGDPFFARVATLNAMGKGWVDFIRSIHAVTLFGRGFGELIRPKSMSNAGCSQWLRLPTERYYLAACVADLRDIMETHGDPRSSPMKLSDNILWFMKENAFQPCPCEKTAKAAVPLPNKHFEPVQALFPLAFKKLLRKRPAVQLQEAAAVIFGHSINIHWHWGDYGDPVKGDPAVEEKSASDLVDDSGLGSSLSSSGSPSSSDTMQPSSSDTDAVLTVPDSKRHRVQEVISSIGKRAKLTK
ncbi:hypothetical protein B0J13DRAFT_37350 [Dactylonectria estremocensis]|uniref:Uncharacterized protein n=1 Tax=Dactylonectria estremocensis TaxID=1079267 RepID=A0A9P9FL44_9HYPO|nr:hypothetical protein B0J13DRAFT_37350 [Dactylonectria estremocensis]